MRGRENTPIYYVKYKNLENKAKAMIGLLHGEGVARLVATEEKKLNISKSVTMEHCFKENSKQPKRGKHPDTFFALSRTEEEAT